MADVQHGQFDEHLDVTGVVQIRGSLLGGATVHSGAALVVQGVLAGPLIIEATARVLVQGTFSAEVHNDGVLALAGVVTTDLPLREGLILVSPGSIFTWGGLFEKLLPDGRLEVVWDDAVRPTDVDLGVERLRLADDGSFTAP